MENSGVRTMSIQDDIYDVEYALKGKPESKCFDKIHTYIGDLERELEMYRAFYRSAVELKVAIQKIERAKK